MNESTAHIPPRRSRAGRIALMAGGAFTGLLAAGALAVGGLALYGESQKDADGYLSTNSHRFAAGSHALASGNLDIDLDGAESVLDSDGMGEVRLRVTPQSDKPVFVGIARTDAVSSYLGEVAHSKVTDVDYSPFKASYSPQDGHRKPAPPAEQGIWETSVHGAGEQTLKWDVEDGNYSVVVMNADGSTGVEADINAGAKAPFLDELGWSALGGGGLLLLVAGGLIVLAARPPRSRPGQPQGAALTPAAG